ncbi:cytochrome P450 9e2-like isoform X2 [Bradysia coprophila]|uniref:cytochrome P450 9e2-like isoform X2 n=1 Tax=Bradysia coprophila TaxID=38358 RepID=UPI00187DB334|nr:cytochrome P450 9e2-like isoform X2 [Bradysia coprophila]
MIADVAIYSAVVIVVVSIVRRLLSSDPASYWEQNGVSMAKTKSFWAKLLQMDFDFVKSDTDIYNQLKAQKYGGVMEFGAPALFITDLDLLKQVLIRDFDHFVNRRGFDLEENDPHMHYLLGNHNGDAWKRLRSTISPTFTGGKIRRIFQIFDSSAKKMVRYITDQLTESSEVELRPNVHKLTMDIIMSAAFGIETNIFEDPNSLYAVMGNKILTQFAKVSTVLKFFLLWLSPKMAKILKVKITDDEADQFLSKVIRESLRLRRDNGTRREDFLQIMLEAQLGQLPEEDENQLDDHEINAKLSSDAGQSVTITEDVIIANCFVFLLGGFDTTESTLSFAIYELAVNPEIQDRLYLEIKAAVDDNHGEFSYDIIQGLRYLDMIVFETLRKYPPFSRTDRRSVKAFTVPGTNFTLPTDSMVIIPIYPIHHDPEYWPEPEKFDPERFTKENSVHRPLCTYSPFGQGPRTRNRFALLECKMALAHLVLNFILEPSPKTDVPIKITSQATLKPVGNVPLHIRSRV